MKLYKGPKVVFTKTESDYYIKDSSVVTVNDVQKILRGNKIKQMYALINNNNELIVEPLGFMKKIQTKDNSNLYVGKIICSDSKKTLFDYYKKQFFLIINHLNKTADERIKSSSLESYNYQFAQRLKKEIKMYEETYKHIITNIKNA